MDPVTKSTLIDRLLGKSKRRAGATAQDPLIPMRQAVRRLAVQAKGFLSDQEGDKLFELAQRSSRIAPCLEIGAYCGKSTLFLAEGCRYGRYNVFSLDHHRGSAEQQRGEVYFDPELYDDALKRPNTLHEFLKNLEAAGLLDCVIPLIGDSARIARNAAGLKLSLLFIDGGHASTDVESDFEGWSGKVLPGGFVCFHDVYMDPEKGGQAPRAVFERAGASAEWRTFEICGCLGVLQRR